MEQARALFESLKTATGLQGLIGKSESLHLEVKEGQSPLSDSSKGYLSQALSGFANSDGGVLVFGLVARRGNAGEPDVVNAVKPFPGFRAAASDIESLVGQAVMPIVEGVQVEPVPSDKNAEYGYVVVLIPASDSGHRAMLTHGGDREYWKRSGDSFYRMEHFDIADMFSRRRRPKLVLSCRPVLLPDHGLAGSTIARQWVVCVGLRNDGRAIARYPMLDITFPSEAPLDEYGIDGKKNFGLRQQPANLAAHQYLFVADAHQVVHPGTVLEVAETKLFTVQGHPVHHAIYPDLTFRYRIAAEDQPLLDGEATISTEQFLAVVRPRSARG